MIDLKIAFLMVAALLCSGAAVNSCSALVVDSSASAMGSGQATMLLGGCRRPVGMGYEVCQIRQGQALPTLQFGFMNPAEWMVSDCHGGLFKSGSLDKPGIVELDISELQSEIDKTHVCWLRVEAIEHYPNPNDSSQFNKIALAGGFIIEALAEGYMPVPAEDMVGWCYKIQRTTSGRTRVSKCR